MIIVGNETFGENARRLKNKISIEDYLKSLGLNIKHSRTRCPICRGSNTSKLLVKNDRVTCFGGCVKSVDIIELHAILNNKNHIESLNDLIAIYSVNRIMPNNFKSIEPATIEFKKNALEYLNKCLNELDMISLLKYELLKQFESIDYCFYLKEKINNSVLCIKNNEYDERQIRNLYKEVMNFINKIKLIEQNESK